MPWLMCLTSIEHWRCNHQVPNGDSETGEENVLGTLQQTA
jgi:hypothetical protein